MFKLVLISVLIACAFAQLVENQVDQVDEIDAIYKSGKHHCKNLEPAKNHDFEEDAAYEFWYLLYSTADQAGKCSIQQLRNNGTNKQSGTYVINNTIDGRRKRVQKFEIKKEKRGVTRVTFEDGRVERHIILYTRYDRDDGVSLIYWCTLKEGHKHDYDLSGYEVYSRSTEVPRRDFKKIEEILRDLEESDSEDSHSEKDSDSEESILDKLDEVPIDEDCKYSKIKTGDNQDNEINNEIPYY